MSGSHFSTTLIDADANAELRRVTDLTLVSHHGRTLTSLEEADEFTVHIGPPARPEHILASTFDRLEDALMDLEDWQRAYPHARLWLSTSEIQTKMLGDTVWEGIVNAQAEFDPYDEDCDRVRLSRIITRAGCDGVPIDDLLKDWTSGHDVSDTVWDIIDHL